MSTYLLALAIGPYETIKTNVGKIPVGVWIPRGKRKLGGYALQVTRHVLPLLENYFGMPYPFEKLDLVVIPEFKYGAMENTAAIFFNETALLVDPNNATVEDLKDLADTITHEISHQWFGDLVTMAWWDDLWLNESFADWLAGKIVATWKPDWKVSDYSVVYKTNAMKEDCWQFTHPIRVDIQEPEEADQVLDAITYSKGAAFLRMLESWLGEQRFRDGIRVYVRKHKEGNTTASDLWKALEEATGQPVVDVGESWTNQSGFPIVRLAVNRKGDNTTITARQKRCSSSPGSAEELWQVPFCIRFGDTERQDKKCWLLSSEEASYELHPEFLANWIYGNANEQGFYYVDYDDDSLTKLEESLNRLTPPERAGLLASQWAATVNGSIALTKFMPLLASYQGQTDTVVIQLLSNTLYAMDSMLMDQKAAAPWQEFVRKILFPLWKSFGWTPAPNETDDQKLRRALVLQTLAEIGRPKELITAIDQKLELYLKNSASLDPSLVSAVVEVSAKFGNSARYDQFLQRAEHSNDPQESERFLYALPLFENSELAKKTFELAIHVKKPISKDTSSRVIALLFANRAIEREIWKWTRNEWSEIRKNLPAVFLGDLIRSTGKLCDQQTRTDMNTFLKDTVHEVARGDRMLQQSLEKIDSCIQLRHRGQEDLAEWLNSR
jgi:puromycin-sensitive aminopeptidase